MGGIKSNFCNKIGSNKRDVCIIAYLWISAAHVPGISTKETNKQSRILVEFIDRQLTPELFKEYCEKFCEI